MMMTSMHEVVWLLNLYITVHQLAFAWRCLESVQLRDQHMLAIEGKCLLPFCHDSRLFARYPASSVYARWAVTRVSRLLHTPCVAVQRHKSGG
jgi:hypothetical protein